MTEREHADDASWTYISSVLGLAKIPTDVAMRLRRFVAARIQDGSVPERAPWQVLEVLMNAYPDDNGAAALGQRVTTMANQTAGDGTPRRIEVEHNGVTVQLVAVILDEETT